MKFAHIADCHVGAWREPKLREVNEAAFVRAMDVCIERGVDFVLIAGDLFNTSLPAIDSIKVVVKKLRELKQKGVAVYAIAGSHDFSPSGKTMLDVLEEAGLLVNVARGKSENNTLVLDFTIDKKTGAKITGMIGRKGTLEKGYYERLDKEKLEKVQGFKIFMFHTAVSEFKQKALEKMDSLPLSFLPKGFDYYAGGHAHVVLSRKEQGYGLIVYPGPLFPNSFSELEKLSHGGFYIYDNGKAEFIPVKVKEVLSVEIDCNHMTPEQVEKELYERFSEKECGDKIITIRLSGTLESGRTSDINFRGVFDYIYNKGAFFVMKNANALISKEFEEIKTEQRNIEELEDEIIKEHLGQIPVQGMNAEKEKELTKRLIDVLSAEKAEGQTQADFEKKIKEEAEALLGISAEDSTKTS